MHCVCYPVVHLVQATLAASHSKTSLHGLQQMAELPSETCAYSVYRDRAWPILQRAGFDGARPRDTAAAYATLLLLLHVADDGIISTDIPSATLRTTVAVCASLVLKMVSDFSPPTAEMVMRVLTPNEAKRIDYAAMCSRIERFEAYAVTRAPLLWLCEYNALATAQQAWFAQLSHLGSAQTTRSLSGMGAELLFYVAFCGIASAEKARNANGAPCAARAISAAAALCVLATPDARFKDWKRVCATSRCTTAPQALHTTSKLLSCMLQLGSEGAGALGQPYRTPGCWQYEVTTTENVRRALRILQRGGAAAQAAACAL